MIDTHCHLYLEQFIDDMDVVIHEAAENGVRQIVVPGIDVETSKVSVDISSKYPNQIYSTVGIHPNYSIGSNPQKIDGLIQSNLEQIFAIGEIGLDFYREYTPHNTQIELFEKMIDLAKIYNLPICIHNRDADKEVIDILQNWYSERTNSSEFVNPGVFHAFNGSEHIAEWGIACGFVFGIGGPVTYKNSHHLREIIKVIGLAHIVLETDAPYLSPVPFRGKRNTPKYLDLIANALADLFNCPKQQVEEMTNKNAIRLFGLKKKCQINGIFS